MIKLLKFFSLISLMISLSSCGTSVSKIKFGNELMVTVGHVGYGLVPQLTPQARQIAEEHCKKFGKSSIYTGIVRDSGVGPEEFDFKCVSNSSTIKKKKNSSSGTGILISQNGYILTNNHVVENCSNVKIGKNRNTKFKAEIINNDSFNDVALLQVNKSQATELLTIFKNPIVPSLETGLFRKTSVELGENVLVAGFPFGDIFGDDLKVTGGMVSSKSGLGNNTSQFQIDAAVQMGNSGGPVYDETGSLIGIVVSQLNKMKIAKSMGSLPENVNYAINSNTVNNFLSSSKKEGKFSTKNKKMGTKELAKIAQLQTVLIKCEVSKD